jgi:hypothetical protein
MVRVDGGAEKGHHPLPREQAEKRKYVTKRSFAFIDSSVLGQEASLTVTHSL